MPLSYTICVIDDETERLIKIRNFIRHYVSDEHNNIVRRCEGIVLARVRGELMTGAHYTNTLLLLLPPVQIPPPRRHAYY